MLKNFFLSEKKLLNAILRAKLKYMKNVLSNEIVNRVLSMCIVFFFIIIIDGYLCMKWHVMINGGVYICDWLFN